MSLDRSIVACGDSTTANEASSPLSAFDLRR
jgi:hypothetical protein